jgi:ubiquitin-conjugating enzyme E2 O
VRWTKREDILTEQTENLRLIDRVFLLGDIVARASDQLGQTGIVLGMRMFCDVRRADGSTLRRVPTAELQPLAACRPGALVVHQTAHWLGRVDEVYDNVQITFDDGSSCKVLRTGAESLSVHVPTMDEQTWFWPGMRVSASRDVLRRARWTRGSFRSSCARRPLGPSTCPSTWSHLDSAARRGGLMTAGTFPIGRYVGKQATVVKVQAAQAMVRWLAAAPVVGAETSIEPPPDMQRPSRLLELMQHHARSCWRLAEHATLPPAKADELAAAAAGEGGEDGEDGAEDGEDSEDGEDGEGAEGAGDRPAEGGAAAGGRPKHGRGSRRGNPSRSRRAGGKAVESTVEVMACHTRIDVVWQDGSRDDDEPATTYAPAKHVDGYYEFWPQDYVVHKADKDTAQGEAPVGVVASVDHGERICVITWRDKETDKERPEGEEAVARARALGRPCPCLSPPRCGLTPTFATGRPARGGACL